MPDPRNATTVSAFARVFGPPCPVCGDALTPASARVDLVGAIDAAHDPGGTGRLELVVSCDHCGSALGTQLQRDALIVLCAGDRASLDGDNDSTQNAEKWQYCNTLITQLTRQGAGQRRKAMTTYHYCATAFGNGSPVAINDGIASSDADLMTDVGYQSFREVIAARFNPPMDAGRVAITSLTPLASGNDAVSVRVLHVAGDAVTLAEQSLALATRPHDNRVENAFISDGDMITARNHAIRALGVLDVLTRETDGAEALRVRAHAVLSAAADGGVA